MNRRHFQIGPGAASLLLIAVVLCMSVLGVLSLVSAMGDARLSSRSAQMAQYMGEVNASSERSLALLDGALVACADAADDSAYLDAVQAVLPDGMSLDGHLVSWVEASGEGHFVECKAQIAPLGDFPRVQWTEHRLYTEIMEEDIDNSSPFYWTAHMLYTAFLGEGTLWN